MIILTYCDVGPNLKGVQRDYDDNELIRVTALILEDGRQRRKQLDLLSKKIYKIYFTVDLCGLFH